MASQEILLVRGYSSWSKKYTSSSLKCPYCKVAINPHYLAAVERDLSTGNSGYIILAHCHDEKCNSFFIIEYYNSIINIPSQPHNDEKEFSENIKTISENFIKIYNESYAAEQYNLMEVCGIGYRKSLEFLIKDYLITILPEQSDEIKTELLAQSIKRINSDNIKQVASRAVWLGNDETHYIRKWEDKNISDLKKLIDLTIHWIESEIITKQYLEDMPHK